MAWKGRVAGNVVTPPVIKLIKIYRLTRILIVLLVQTCLLLLTLPFVPASKRSLHRATYQQKATLSFLNTLKIKVDYPASITAVRPGLIVSNHLGVLDPVILAAYLPVCFAAKAEMAKWFFVGFVCKLVGTIFVHRDRKFATTRFVEEVRNRIESGVSVLVFPEGTTSTGESLRPFKTGAFEAITHLSANSVIPVFIRIMEVNGEASLEARKRLTWANPEQPLLANAWSFLGIKSATVKVLVGSSIVVGDADRKQLANQAYLQVKNLMFSLEQEPVGTIPENLKT